MFKSNIVLTALAVAISGFLFGYNMGVISGALFFIKATFSITDAQTGAIVSAVPVGALIASVLNGKLCDIFGRKKMVFALILLNTFSLFLITVAHGVPLYLACTMSGFSIFGLLATTDAYLSDITPEESLRTMIGVNVSASFIVGAIISPLLGNMIDIYGFILSFALLSITTLISILSLTRIRNLV